MAPVTDVEVDPDAADGDGITYLLDRLSEGLPGWPDELPAAWVNFRKLTEARVQGVGQKQYGDAWRGRDNLVEAIPELADAMAYLAWDSAQHDYEDIDLTLMAILHAFRAYELALRLRAKREGAA